jgi:peptide/nickel transport system ATP-binding protein
MSTPITGVFTEIPSRSGEIALSVKNLCVNFPTDDGVVHAVRDISFDLREGEVLGVVGESGSGKSVSSMAVMGLLPKNAEITGSVEFEDREIVGMSDKQMRSIRGNGIAMIFQDPMTSLNPVYTIGWQLAEAYRSHHQVSKQVAAKRVLEVLDVVGIPQPDRRAKQFPHEFSGGMRQRVMIAMAVINEPKIIIADEPTTALDVTVQAQILDTLRLLRDELSAAIIMITHDLGVVTGIADRVQVMYAGTMVETGNVRTVFTEPRMPYTVGLLSSIPRADSVGIRLRPIKGAPPSLVNMPPGCPFSPRCPLSRADCDESEPDMVDVDSPGHQARCRHWDEVAATPDPRSLFDTSSDADAVLPGDDAILSEEIAE